MKTSRIGDYLDYLFPEPKCELNYKSDYELLIAIMLSAQSTDKRVNVVLPEIFSKYSTLEELMQADLSDLETIIRPVGSFRKKAYYTKEISKRLLFGSMLACSLIAKNAFRSGSIRLST